MFLGLAHNICMYCIFRRFIGFQNLLDIEMKDATANGIDVASKKKLRSEITEEEEIVLWQKKLWEGTQLNHSCIQCIFTTKNFSVTGRRAPPVEVEQLFIV